MTNEIIDYEELIKPYDIPISSMEVDLSIGQGFFVSLMHEKDDWSFLIKIYTLIDTSLAYLIGQSLNKPELVELIERINITGGKTSKLEFVKNLSLLDKNDINFINELSPLRNAASHTIQAITISLITQVANYSNEKIMKLIKIDVPKTKMSPKEIQKFVDFVKREPRVVIWISVMDLLKNIYLKKQELERSRRPNVSSTAIKLAEIMRNYSPKAM